MLAISAASLLFAVTWSAGPAPTDRQATIQRWCIAVGGAGVALTRAAGAPGWVVAAFGAVFGVGLAVLAALLVDAVRRGSKRRFDVAVGAYVAALTSGLAGVGFGVAIVLGQGSPHLRDGHVVANLLGLVGLVVGGTLPYFAATVGRSRMAPGATPRALGAITAWQASMVAIVLASLAFEVRSGAVLGLVGYVVGVGAVMSRMPRVGPSELDRSGPRLIALWAGGAWWATAVAATAADVGAGRPALHGRWLLVLVLAGYAQVLWGSLAYLLPMLAAAGTSSSPKASRRPGRGPGWPP